MGVQALRLVVPLEKKEDITFTTPATTAVVAPAANSVAIVTMLAAADVHRELEIQMKVRELIDHLREKDFFGDTSTDIFVAMKITESKVSIRSSTTFNEIITGDIALTLDAVLRDPGAKNWVLNAFHQTLAFMNEKTRLAV